MQQAVEGIEIYDQLATKCGNIDLVGSLVSCTIWRRSIVP